MKKNRSKLITLDSRLAWDRCRTCERIGIGKHAGRCMHHRIGNDYPPIERVFSCPIGRKVGDKEVVV